MSDSGGEFRFIFPVGAFGASDADGLLDKALRKIGVAVSENPKDEWAEKYGTNFENDVFMMHRYCWCDENDCPWCAGCECPDEAYHHWVDGKEVTHDEWVAFYRREVGAAPDRDCSAKAHTEYMERAKRVNERRPITHDPACDYCRGDGIFASNGSEPGRGAPNFWYKPTNFKVWWYKYIGRDMDTNRTPTTEEIANMLHHCLTSIGKRP